MAIELKLLREGKTKKIWHYPLSTYEVLIESKDDITAGDGAKRIQVKNKGLNSTETTANCFEFLRNCNIQNHFVKRENESTFRALKLHMIPIEVVIRRIATGTSYPKRNPHIQEGMRFTWPVVEFFDKDDAMHDPLLIYDLVSSRILRYDAKLPISQGFIDEKPIVSRTESAFMIEKLTDIGEQVFLDLEKAWATLNVTLCDLKIECGRNVVTGGIMLGDAITNDKWRLWPNGDKSRELSKQVFRDMTEVTPEKLSELEANYEFVADMTRRFSNL